MIGCSTLKNGTQFQPGDAAKPMKLAHCTPRRHDSQSRFLGSMSKGLESARVDACFEPKPTACSKADVLAVELSHGERGN